MSLKELNEYKGAVVYHDLTPFFNDIKDLSYCVVKGEALSILAYGNVGMRSSSDIDILISRKDIKYIVSCLKKYGYKYKSDKGISKEERAFFLSNSHQWKPLVKQIGFVESVVDINFDIFWGEYTGKRIIIEDFLSNPRELKVYGCKVKTLSVMKSFLCLVLHHYKDMNSIFLLATKNSIKSSLFKDIYYFLINHSSEVTPDALYTECKRYNIMSYAYYVLYYTGQIYNDLFINTYINRLRDHHGEALIDYYGLNEKEKKKWNIDFFQRLDSKELYRYIYPQLSLEDIKKIEINNSFFR